MINLKTYIIFNPSAGNRTGEKKAHELENILKEENLVYVNITRISVIEFLEETQPEDIIIICGGDGTLNRLINELEDTQIKNDIFLYAGGSGNDFLSDINMKDSEAPVKINEYINNLPVVRVNGKSLKFINGAGLGLDGYVCEEGNRKREKNGKPINYLAVALKGIFYGYKPCNAKVTVDGKEYTYKKVWLAPTMKGRFCGGGFMLAPNQDRLSPDITFIIAHNLSRFKLLTILPKAFYGGHIKHKKNISLIEGKRISVEFERPCPMQIDGEVIPNVLKYEVSGVSEKLEVRSLKMSQ